MRACKSLTIAVRESDERADGTRHDERATAMPTFTSAWRSAVPGRTITDADLVGFAGLTGDYSELHTSDVYAKSSQFGRRVAHGMLGLAYAHGLMWPRTGELRETAIAFLGISDWKFVGPIFIGDTIFVNYAIAELRDSKSRPTQAIATFDVAVVNQDDAVVQRGGRRCSCPRCRWRPSRVERAGGGEAMTHAR